MHKAPRGAACAALPANLLAEVLQHVPQQQRLTQCSLVSSAWATAAAQATVHLEFLVRAKAASSLQSWLAVHAGQLLTLKLCTSLHDKLQLPLDKLTNLQHLELQGCRLLLPGEQDRPRSSANDGGRNSRSEDTSSTAQLTLSSLQQLELSSVQLSSFSSLLRLTRAPQLKHLSLSNIDVSDLDFCSSNSHRNPQHAVEAAAEATCSMLQQLPQLSVVRVHGLPFSDAAVQQTSALLKDVSISYVGHFPPCDLQQLCSSITRLQLWGNSSPLSPSLPELPELTALLGLELKSCLVPPGVLGSVPQLQDLHMLDCRLLPDEGTFSTAGTAALLDVLPKLTRLQDLTLRLPDWTRTTLPRSASQH